MSYTYNPPRLFEVEETPTELRNLLRRAHDDTLSGSVVAQLARAIERRSGSCVAGRSQPRLASWSLGLRRHSTKLFIAVAALGIGLVTGKWYFGNSASKAGPSHNSEIMEPSFGATEATAAPPQVVAQQATTVGKEQKATTPPAPRPSVAPPSRARGRSTGAFSANKATQTTGDPAASATTVSLDEYRLLRLAQQALAERPERALELTDEHKKQFPDGMLAQEREAIAIEALVQMGREEVARTRAATLLATYPNSPYRSRIMKSLGRVDIL